MDNSNYFKELLKSIEDYRTIVLLMFLIKIDSHFITECGFLESDIFHLDLEF